MADISLQISAQTVTNLGSITNTLGQAVQNQISYINTLEEGFNSDFTDYLFGYESGSYIFPNATQIVINTTDATYTFNGSNIESQVNAALANHSGSANISTATLYDKLNGDTVTLSGNIVLTGNSTEWYLDGSLTSEKITTPSTSTVDAGTSQTASLLGNITYVNGVATSATITSDTFTTNGYVTSQIIKGNITITESGSSFLLGGTVSATSQNYSNGDYINVTGLNIPSNGSFSLKALPNGGNTLTGTYSGLTITGGTGNDVIAAGIGSNTISGGGGTDTITFRSSLSSYTIQPQSNGSYVVTSSVTGEGPDTLNQISLLQFTDKTVNLVGAVSVSTALSESQDGQLTSAATILDSAANVQKNLAALEGLATSNDLTAIILNDSTTPTITISSAQQTADAAAIGDIASAYTLTVLSPAAYTATNAFSDVLFDSSSANNHALITSYATQLASGALTTAQVVADIVALPETAIVDYVYSLYSSTLDFPLSNSTAGGLAYWVQQVEKQLTPAQVAAGQLTTAAILFLDQSFINAAGTGGTPALATSSGAPTVASATNLVDQFYAQGLGNTAPAASGVSYWVGQYLAVYIADGATSALQFLVNSFANAVAVVDADSIVSWLTNAALSDTGSGATYGSAIYRLSQDTQSSVTEGSTETFAFTSAGVTANTTLYYTLSGVTSSEVVGGHLTGTITVGSNGTAALPVTLTNTPGEGLNGHLTATLSTTQGGLAVASASEALTETPASVGSVALVGVPSVGSHAEVVG